MNASILLMNIKHFIKDKTALFTLLMLSQILVFTVLFYSFGTIQNAFAVREEIDDNSKYFEVLIDVMQYDDITGEPVYVYEKCYTKQDFFQKSDSILNLIPNEYIASVNYKGIVSEEGKNTPLTFLYSNTNPRDCVGVYSLIEGYKTGDTIVLNGREHIIQESGNFAADLVLPQVYDDYVFYRLRIELNQTPSPELIDDVKLKIEEEFGIAEVHVPQIPDLLENQFNRATIALSAIVILISALNLTYAYTYIISKRKKWIFSSLLIGAHKNDAINIFAAEIVIYLIASFALSVLLFENYIKNLVAMIYPQIETFYSASVYLILGVVLIAVIVLMTNASLESIVEKSVAELGREATE